MKKIVSIILLVILQAVLLYLLRGNFTSGREKEMRPFALTFGSGRVINFTKNNFPQNVILYYFTPDCKLCFSEVNDIITYSKKQNINPLFVTTSDLSKAKSFSMELEHRGITADQADEMIARIREEDVAGIFGEITAPQCVLFGRGLEVKGVRKGIITDQFLAKMFR